MQKKYIAIEKDYVVIKKETEKHPHEGSLGSQERARREGGTGHREGDREGVQ
tara:strand:- start:241 stop:396 length:156 start_codon:yes stop_codon:yes gene_type:complete